MQRTQYPFDVFHPDIDETLLENEAIEKAVERLARGKAHAAKDAYPNALIIGCDQLLSVNNVILGKPHTHERAVAQLSQCSNQLLHSYTGIALLNSQTGTIQTDVITYQVKFKELSQSLIERYLHKDKPYQCAGSIKAESMGFTLFSWTRGDDINALIGLPLIRLNEMLLNEQVDITL